MEKRRESRKSVWQRGSGRSKSLWEEDKSEVGVVWFSSVVEYERKREERQKAFERVRQQGLLRDFPNLKRGGLLPNPEPEEEKPRRLVAHEWTVIVAPRDAKLCREWEKSAAPFPEGPDESGWVRHSCCGTICVMRSAPPP